ncbi:hypothetical protein Premu_0075 [Hallella multisaccharivorax DSM 17128]|uniref:Uncharacterized protein n=1 Tax=Hallella multisaccharivorax DSM 17128 TaxID=688246 RepID=F8N5B0_9BACT|nr:hypothetical protein Premu_0075 [Hallella multisaccharivorax DSM 17128]
MKQLLKSVKGIKFSKMLVSKIARLDRNCLSMVCHQTRSCWSIRRNLSAKNMSATSILQKRYTTIPIDIRKFTWINMDTYIMSRGTIENWVTSHLTTSGRSDKGKEYLNISNRPNPKKDSCLRYSYFASI